MTFERRVLQSLFTVVTYTPPTDRAARDEFPPAARSFMPSPSAMREGQGDWNHIGQDEFVFDDRFFLAD